MTASRGSLRRRFGWVAALGIVVLAASPIALGMHLIAPSVDGPLPDSAGELEDAWDAVLAGAVHDGVVDYRVIAERRATLHGIAAALGSVGPQSTPAAFPDRESALAYYVNAYNALVVLAVIDRDVRGGVHEVHGLIEPASGMGFFWALRFRLDGEIVSLHGLETDVLRARFHDARVHAAIVCASRSCPMLAERAYRGATLDAQLDEAARRFASSPEHVRVDDASRTIELSSIFSWYEDDFTAEVEPSTGSGVLAWIEAHRDPERRVELERAEAAGYRVAYAVYDWRLNGHW